jgi:hypothetical protein
MGLPFHVERRIIPQPGGTTHPRGIPMCRRQKTGAENIGKNMWTAAGGQIAVKPLQVRQAATQHDHLRIEDVDDAGQRPSQAGFVTLQGGFAIRVAGFRIGGDGGRVEGLPGMALMIGGQTGAGKIGFDTAGTTAVTGGCRLITAGVSERVVSPFAGNGVGAGSAPDD